MHRIERYRRLIFSQIDRKKRYRFLLPHCMSFASVLLGFFSLVCCLQGLVEVAAYAIFYAVLLDGLDGRLARAWGTESKFGQEIDSLADALSFCVAPGLLVYTVCQQQASAFPAVALFVCAGIFRLARFNSTPVSLLSFTGMPTTFAAFFVVNMVLCGIQHEGRLFDILEHELLVVVVLCALCMISTVQFPSLKDFTRFQRSAVFRFMLLFVCFVLYLGRFHGLMFIALSLFLFMWMAGVCGNSAKRLRSEQFYR